MKIQKQTVNYLQNFSLIFVGYMGLALFSACDQDSKQSDRTGSREAPSAENSQTKNTTNSPTKKSKSTNPRDPEKDKAGSAQTGEADQVKSDEPQQKAADVVQPNEPDKNQQTSPMEPRLEDMDLINNMAAGKVMGNGILNLTTSKLLKLN